MYFSKSNFKVTFKDFRAIFPILDNLGATFGVFLPFMLLWAFLNISPGLLIIHDVPWLLLISMRCFIAGKRTRQLPDIVGSCWFGSLVRRLSFGSSRNLSSPTLGRNVGDKPTECLRKGLLVRQILDGVGSGVPTDATTSTDVRTCSVSWEGYCS